jgi:hypothetical protein
VYCSDIVNHDNVNPKDIVNSYRKIADNVNRLVEIKRSMWSYLEHNDFPIYFKQRIFNFLLCLRRVRKNNTKIPKFVLFEIIKKVI